LPICARRSWLELPNQGGSKRLTKERGFGAHWNDEIYLIAIVFNLQSGNKILRGIETNQNCNLTRRKIGRFPVMNIL
jgi:hypothetical protein